MVKIFRFTNLLLIAASLIALICHVKVSEGRLLMIPQKTSKNLIEDALDNIDANNCKVNIEILETFELLEILAMKIVRRIILLYIFL